MSERIVILLKIFGESSTIKDVQEELEHLAGLYSNLYAGHHLFLLVKSKYNIHGAAGDDRLPNNTTLVSPDKFSDHFGLFLRIFKF
jgi:hypothetical protein